MDELFVFSWSSFVEYGLFILQNGKKNRPNIFCFSLKKTQTFCLLPSCNTNNSPDTPWLALAFKIPCTSRDTVTETQRNPCCSWLDCPHWATNGGHVILHKTKTWLASLDKNGRPKHKHEIVRLSTPASLFWLLLVENRVSVQSLPSIWKP